MSSNRGDDTRPSEAQTMFHTDKILTRKHGQKSKCLSFCGLWVHHSPSSSLLTEMGKEKGESNSARQFPFSKRMCQYPNWARKYTQPRWPLSFTPDTSDNCLSSHLWEFSFIICHTWLISTKGKGRSRELGLSRADSL